ncbi:hypothetical protein ACHAWF_006096 [Thalassiosira exigua]
MAAVQLWISIVAMVAFCASGFRLPMTPARLLRRHYDEGHAPRLSLQSSGNSPEATPSCRCRRKLIQQTSAAVAASLLLPPSPASASEDAPQQPSQTYTRTPSPGDKFQFGYTITPPPGFAQGNKPLKTHLDEINFSPPDRGYTLGITVDPVRIKRISEFGTPEEVAARVVTAEVNRDGVFKVTLAKDPREGAGGECYDVEYVSDGKRGTKRFATRIYVRDGFLYVLTVQSKESDYDEAREADVQECVKSFAPV